MKQKAAFFVAVLLVLSLAAPLGVLAAPNTPDGLTATVSVGSITLVWNDNSSDETGFEIERKESIGPWEILEVVDANANIYLDIKVSMGETYTYRVRAIDASVSPTAYSGYSNEATGTIGVVAAPTNLTAVTGANSITLSWTSNSDDEDGFVISKVSRYDIWGNPLFKDIWVDANTTTYIDFDVELDEIYSYEVLAYISGPAETGIPSLYSAHSNSVTVSVRIMPNLMSNFRKVDLYTAGKFTDVSEDAWYGYNKQKVIANAFEYGLMRGSSATIFNPTGNMTVAEAITVAARVHSIYSTGVDDLVQSGSPWFKVYTDYAIENGIISAGAFPDYERPATRAEMAYIFCNSLPVSEFQKRNTVISLPDVFDGSDSANGEASTPYYEYIIRLYEAGVLTGNDDFGTFYPGSNIIRAEAAAIISRVILPAIRIGGGTFG